MPKVTIPLVGVNESVSRMVITDLTNQLKEMLGLGHIDDTRITNYNGNIRSFQTAVGSDNNRYASFSGKTRLFVEAEENYNQDGWATANIGRVDAPPLFYDDKLDLYISPDLIPCDLILKFKFQTRSQDEARRWFDDIVAYLNMLRDGSQHRLRHHICLSPVVWTLMHHAYELRENFQGYGESFQDYIQNHSHVGLTLISAADGDLPIFTYGRTLDRVNGKFDISPFPDKPTFDESGGIWECQLSYKVTYDRPTHCSVKYPIQIHQQLLEDKYIIPNNHPSNMNDRRKELTQSQKAFSLFESYNLNGYSVVQDACIRIPDFDDYVIPISPKSTATIMLGLLSLEKTGEQILMNLNDLGDEEIDPDILDYLAKEEYSFLNQPFKSFFLISLYRGDDLIHPDCYRVDEHLNIWMTDKEDIDLRKSYRVRLSLVVDPNLLNFPAFKRMFNYPKVIVKLVAAINDAIRHNVDLLDQLKLRQMKEWEFTELWWVLKGMAPVPQTSTGAGWGGTKNPGKTFGITDEAFDSIRTTFRLRTVQIQGTFVSKRT